MTDKSEDRVGYLNTILTRGGGNLKDPIFKSSNARPLPWAGRMMKFRFDMCVKEYTEKKIDFVFAYYEAPLKLS